MTTNIRFSAKGLDKWNKIIRTIFSFCWSPRISSREAFLSLEQQKTHWNAWWMVHLFISKEIKSLFTWLVKSELPANFQCFNQRFLNHDKDFKRRILTNDKSIQDQPGIHYWIWYHFTGQKTCLKSKFCSFVRSQKLS